MDTLNKEKQGKKLYKYIPLSNWDFENIFNEKLFLRTATFFNDVFDSAPFYSEDVFNTILKSHIENFGMILPESLSNNSQSIDDKFKIYRSHFRNLRDSAIQDSALISCFSEDNQSNIMWAHYGNIYQGAILEYDASELLEAAKTHLIELKHKGMFNLPDDILKRGPMLEKVVYSEYRADISDEVLKAHKLVSKYGEPLDYNDPKYSEIKLEDDIFKKQQRLMFLTKALEWSYEKEWRLIIPNYFSEKVHPGTKKGKTLTIGIKPKSIILGYKIPQEKAKKLIQLAISKKIDLFGSGPDYFSDKPKILVEPLKDSFIGAMLQ
jgi:hypothetical protein